MPTDNINNLRSEGHRELSELRIAMIGAGNVASHLAVALDAVARVTVVYSRHLGHAAVLASRLRDARAVDDLTAVGEADIYLISVADDAVAAVAAQLPADALRVHTSGSVGIDALGDGCRRGVFYPLQTFSREASLDMRRVPVFIEASDAGTEALLMRLASAIADNVRLADSARRKVLHIAAVFACNFANYMWTLADDVLRDHDLDLSVLAPLLGVTLDKAVTLGPEAAQTGPARRGDRHVTESHIAVLPADKAAVYRLLTDCITQRYER